MKPHKVATALTVIFYSVSICKVILEYGGTVIMKTLSDIIAHYQSKPWDVLGLPFLFLAVGMTIWLIYDAVRRRRRQRIGAEQRRNQNIIEVGLRDGRQKERIAVALNEVREKLGLPSISIYDPTNE